MSEVKSQWFQSGFVAGVIATVAMFYLWIHHEPQKAVEQPLPDNVVDRRLRDDNKNISAVRAN